MDLCRPFGSMTDVSISEHLGCAVGGGRYRGARVSTVFTGDRTPVPVASA